MPADRSPTRSPPRSGMKESYLTHPVGATWFDSTSGPLMSAESDHESDRIETLERRVAELESSLEDRGSSSTRRKVLGGLAGAGILGMGSASAQTSAGSTSSVGDPTSTDEMGGSPMALNVDDDPRGKALVGSRNPNQPNKNLASKIERGLSNGVRHFQIRGAWTMGKGGLNISSGKYAPYPINLDCRGAFIEYRGSGWCITNDNSNHHRGQNQGGFLRLHGGFWKARRQPRGWFRGIDVCLNEIYPAIVRSFKGASYRVLRPETKRNSQLGSGLPARRKVGSAVIQLEEGGMNVNKGRWTGGKWTENNKIGGRFHGIDTGIRGVGSRGKSFQGNFIDRVVFSRTNDYGLDLSGNWMECKFDKLEMTTPSEGSALLRHNGNMGGSVITAPETEDAKANLDNYYYTEIGPFATEGPQTVGGFWTNPAGQTFIKDPFAGTNKQPPWGHFATRMVNGSFYFERYSNKKSQRFGLTPNGFEFSTSNNARNWTTQYRVSNSGNTQR